MNSFLIISSQVTVDLLADLGAKNVKVIGTVRENRTVGASSKMKSLKEMKKIRQRSIQLSS